MLITEPLFYLCAIPAVLLTGISKGGFGGALGGLAVPLMALAISPVQAAAIMLPVLCLMDWVGLKPYWRQWDSANIRILLPGGLIGVVAGTLSFGLLSENVIRLLIGALAVLFALTNLSGFAASQKPAAPSVPKGVLWSAVSGFTSFLAHAGGPPVMMFLLPQRLDKTVYVATINLFFLVTNAVKLLPYAGLGQFSAANLVTSLLLVPLVPFGVWLGLWLHRRFDQTWFYRIAQIGLLLTGLQLIYVGTSSL
ncbi:MAG: sulfite exporter TauE/SafE family protein [Candidatus Competibacteraceae bacterium]|nr:sulfite exporter TauE/SafE family protein [Candidatus Competibacteraceae bacterium]